MVLPHFHQSASRPALVETLIPYILTGYRERPGGIFDEYVQTAWKPPRAAHDDFLEEVDAALKIALFGFDEPSEVRKYEACSLVAACPVQPRVVQPSVRQPCDMHTSCKRWGFGEGFGG
jgi:hypothetical protein